VAISGSPANPSVGLQSGSGLRTGVEGCHGLGGLAVNAPGGWSRYRTGSRPPRAEKLGTPWVERRQEPAAPVGRLPRWALLDRCWKTMEAGRFLRLAPRPFYVAHEPRLGQAGDLRSRCSFRIWPGGEWLKRGVHSTHERPRSSDTLAAVGHQLSERSRDQGIAVAGELEPWAGQLRGSASDERGIRYDIGSGVGRGGGRVALENLAELGPCCRTASRMVGAPAMKQEDHPLGLPAPFGGEGAPAASERVSASAEDAGAA